MSAPDIDHDDPWARLEAARARHGIHSPIKRSTGEQAAPAPAPAPTKQKKPRAKSARTPQPAPSRAEVIRRRAEFQRLAAEGATAASIARELHVSITRVRQWADDDNVDLPDGRSRGGPGRPAAWNVDRAVRLAKEGRTVQEIAPQVGASISTVRRVLNRRGVELVDGRALHSGQNNPVTRALEALSTRHLTDLYGQLKSVAAVAEALDLPANTTGRLLRSRGIAVRPSSEVQAGRPGEDHAGPLRDLMDANGTTPAEVREWALAHGLSVAARGVPSRAVVEDYLLAHTVAMTA